MDIQEIKVEKFPVIIFSDNHCNLVNINKLRSLYPYNQIICLGDFTSLWTKKDDFNENSINYFAENKIPCLQGNHEQHIRLCQEHTAEYKISKNSLDYLKSLGIGFKLILPSGNNYFFFHNRPNDLWSFTEENTLSKDEFKNIYPSDDKTIGIIHGHGHKPYVVDYPNLKMRHYQIGALKFKDYAIITEEGVQFKSL